MSGAGYQVVLTDLQGMAGAFQHESAAFSDIMPGSGPPCPDGGGADINTAMGATVQLLGLLHQQMASVIGEHAGKLRAAHDHYEHTETSLARLATQLAFPGTV